LSFGQPGINRKFKTVNFRLDCPGSRFNFRQSFLLKIPGKRFQDNVLKSGIALLVVIEKNAGISERFFDNHFTGIQV